MYRPVCCRCYQNIACNGSLLMNVILGTDYLCIECYKELTEGFEWL